MAQDNELNIWPPYEAFYIEGMFFCLNSLESSLQRANELLETAEAWTQDPRRFDANISAILDHFQNIAAQAASISRYLWPARNNNAHAQRGELLRRCLGVTENSALKNRDLRNQMEHFDENLDAYLQRGILGDIIPKYVGPTPAQTEAPTHYFRAYFYDTHTLEVLGKRYAMEPLLSEAARIHEELSRCAAEGFRLRPRPSEGTST